MRDSSKRSAGGARANASSPTRSAWTVFACDGVPRARPKRLPDGGLIVSSPLGTTLIFGEREAVLVDPPFTRDQIQLVLLLAAQGVTEIVYQPAGDIRPELESFADATGLREPGRKPDD